MFQNNVQRVKVYRLTNDGQWDDQGTGHITIDYIEGSREIALAVVDGVDNDTLLLHHLTLDNIYKRQEQTLISLKDPEKALDLLLSFQEAKGCLHIW
ncbi:Suppressor of Mek1 [Zea mays]|uniref:Suppressor of Mek1 n=1 Tax=Zea mays TaxID=4577 RepID=A0A3L6E7K4_MAIZE|nr:Suppressor of Mek1 [Zea mays]